MRALEDIEASFLKVKSSARAALVGDDAAKDEALQDIFGLNNEIGMLARQRPETMPKMRELQGYVNMITVGIKYARKKDLVEGLSVVEKTIKRMKREISSGS